MILTGKQIKWAKEQGYLDISDWDESRLNPNSYNLRLADEIATYFEVPLIYKEWDKLDYTERTYYWKKCETDPDFRQWFDDNIDKTGKLPKFPGEYGLDMKQNMRLVTQRIPEEGFVLQPGILYLARTMEYTKTDKFVPMLEGRSSVGRLGISVHSTAGFGDIGFEGYWTLEISCVQPVRIYSGVEICQIYYHMVGRLAGEEAEEYYGDIYIPKDENLMKYNSGKYQKNEGIQPSMMWKELQ